jgi:hypothetical protein
VGKTAFFLHAPSNRLIEKPKNNGCNWVGYPNYGWLFLWADELLVTSQDLDSRTLAMDNSSVRSALEIFLGGKWEPFGDREQDVLAARAQGAAEFRYQTRGQEYVVDFRTMQQVNVSSGRARELRIQD